MAVANAAFLQPLNDMSVQDPNLQQRCWGVTSFSESHHHCDVRFCSILPVPRPILSAMCSVDDNEWRRVMTIVVAYGSGYNTVMDKWVSTKQIANLYQYIFRKPFPFRKWNIDGPGPLGSMLSQRLTLWTDACDFDYVRLPKDGHRRRTMTFPRTEWYLHCGDPLDDSDWFNAYEELRANVERYLCNENYLDAKMMSFMQLNPSASMDWIKSMRSEVYCVLVCYYPLGVDIDAIFETFQKLYHKNLGMDLNGTFTISMLIGNLIDDITIHVRESQMHSYLYPIFYHALDIPQEIMESRKMTKTTTLVEGQGGTEKVLITVNGGRVPQKRRLTDHLRQ